MYENFSDTKCKTWIHSKNDIKLLSMSMCNTKKCFIWSKMSKTIKCQKIASSKYMVLTSKIHVMQPNSQIINQTFKELNIHRRNETCHLGNLYVQKSLSSNSK